MSAPSWWWPLAIAVPSTGCISPSLEWGRSGGDHLAPRDFQHAGFSWAAESRCPGRVRHPRDPGPRHPWPDAPGVQLGQRHPPSCDLRSGRGLSPGLALGWATPRRGTTCRARPCHRPRGARAHRASGDAASSLGGLRHPPLFALANAGIRTCLRNFIGTLRLQSLPVASWASQGGGIFGSRVRPAPCHEAIRTLLKPTGDRRNAHWYRVHHGAVHRRAGVR